MSTPDLSQTPAKVAMRCILYGDGKGGSFLQVYRNDEWGVQVEVSAESRRGTATQAFTCDHIDGVYPSWLGLRAAMRAAGKQQKEQGNDAA